MRERLLIVWASVLCRVADVLQRRLLVVHADLQEAKFRRMAAEYHADLERIAREAAESERKLRER